MRLICNNSICINSNTNTVRNIISCPHHSRLHNFDTQVGTLTSNLANDNILQKKEKEEDLGEKKKKKKKNTHTHTHTHVASNNMTRWQQQKHTGKGKTHRMLSFHFRKVRTSVRRSLSHKNKECDQDGVHPKHAEKNYNKKTHSLEFDSFFISLPTTLPLLPHLQSQSFLPRDRKMQVWKQNVRAHFQLS